ncbi:(2Fe-2S)-binding protein [Desulfobacter vibrioformis]|uniref:(2Fe-2S)-binding protein n=1 Tax=Desulfobacter vibrioformis TaxID=34031 RepID=UPI00054E32D9|nr:(2Fe-2S)-binding protein [Desulfobacter vibrioformis]
MKLEFTLNSAKVTVETAPDRRLIDLLREDLGLTGTKEGCGTGECGACTIRVQGETKLACLMLAAQVQGCDVVTIEGLDPAGHHPVQEAFTGSGAVQCGFCTPGMIMSLSTYLAAHPDPAPEKIREAVSGNLCRCTGYQKIVDAGLAAARALKEAHRG